MKTLTEKFAELTTEAKLAEDRMAKALTEGKERVAQRREEVRQNVRQALEKLADEIQDAPQETKIRFEEFKSKLRERLEEAKEQGFGDGSKAKQLFLEKQIEARAAIRYAIAATRLAEFSALEAVALKHLVELKAEQPPVQA